MKNLTILLFLISAALNAQNKKINKLITNIEPKVIEWRRDFHQHPELSNREFKTAEKIAKYLKSLGLEVQTNVAHTGVVGILRGGKPGAVVALRADIDALPVTERTPVAFASKVTSTYNGIETGVMHACGHDSHIAILMGTAEVLTKIKDEIRGTVKFIFQPAEEGAPKGERGGAELMVEEGVLKNPDVDAIFGLHISAITNVGIITYKPAGIMAAAQSFTIKVKGKQAHGSRPWEGIDPIVISAQIINGLQTIISRGTELTKEAAVITVGLIRGGVRSNIIPEEVEMIGTIRTLDYDMQKKLNKEITRRVPAIAEAFGATATIEIDKGYPITYNDVNLVNEMLPSLQKAAGKNNVKLINAVTGAEDFSFYQKEIPGFYFFLGGKPLDVSIENTASHHTPDFFIDESGFKLGVEAFVNLTLDYLNQNPK
ncbi:N-acyl-L-amino acid amidohydrolase [Lutibacter profundi]|uniref:N-acyl-L-amino acid amidohydrolase n=1 Tax=Lutibacter profundi TaxID=1622118 RepID=A0A0X8G6L6_9FLAO|nr:amidohydrolase [Lutibacter profundi]AMC10983.1 N-acyl-L-amino acid amidohydrolase [Lutibacter profundi]